MNDKLLKIREKIGELYDPYLQKKLKETNGIAHLAISEDQKSVTVIINVGKKIEKTHDLRLKIASIIKIEYGFAGARIQIDEAKRSDTICHSKVNFIAVASGKGGVGKSTVAVNIANSLVKAGKKVGIIDADIYGSSIPTILNLPPQHLTLSEKKEISPICFLGMHIMSTEFLTNPSQPVVWRGAILTKMLNFFFNEVIWPKDLEYLVIDLPPGTGDIALDLKNLVPQAEILLVTTPNPCAAHVAIKAGYAALNMGQQLLGVIENMSYFINPVNQQQEYIFGQGGGQAVSLKLGTELLAQIPIGQPQHHVGLFESHEKQGIIYDDLAQYIIFHFDSRV